jgi:pimeloyl-ACP methyl ester carboxylesterase
MSRSTIFFAPGNGFPAGSYAKMLDALGSSFDVDRIELPGHNPDFPPDENWVSLKTELIAEIRARHEKPVIGVGHSLGGVLHLLAAAEDPKLYSQIILLEAPIISPLSSRSLRLMKYAGLIDRLSPSQATRYRRSRWDSREEALEHFASKPKFAAFDPEVLRDYVDFGTVETARGFELAFRPRIEALIYRTIPHNLPRLKGRLRLPLTFVGGSDSRESRLARTGFMRRAFDIRFETVEGSHLFPLESPIKAAEVVLASIQPNPAA